MHPPTTRSSPLAQRPTIIVWHNGHSVGLAPAAQPGGCELALASAALSTLLAVPRAWVPMGTGQGCVGTKASRASDSPAQEGTVPVPVRCGGLALAGQCHPSHWSVLQFFLWTAHSCPNLRFTGGVLLPTLQPVCPLTPSPACREPFWIPSTRAQWWLCEHTN